MNNDSHSLHILMLAVIASRKAVPAMPRVSTLLSALGDLQHGFETNVGLEANRERALDLACLAFRVAVELQSPVTGLPVVVSTTKEFQLDQ